MGTGHPLALLALALVLVLAIGASICLAQRSELKAAHRLVQQLNETAIAARRELEVAKEQIQNLSYTKSMLLQQVQKADVSRKRQFVNPEDMGYAETLKVASWLEIRPMVSFCAAIGFWALHSLGDSTLSSIRARAQFSFILAGSILLWGVEPYGLKFATILLGTAPPLASRLIFDLSEGWMLGGLSAFVVIQVWDLPREVLQPCLISAFLGAACGHAFLSSAAPPGAMYDVRMHLTWK